MLTVRRVGAARLLLAAAVSMTAVVADPATTARAASSGGVYCPPDNPDCLVRAKAPGQPGRTGHTGSSGGSAPGCAIDGQAVPCHRPGMGDFNPQDACYWAVLDPQPPADDPVWKLAVGLPAHWKPGEDQGELYNVTCPGTSREVDGGTFWSAGPPKTGGPDLKTLAQQAVRAMRLEGPNIGIDPKPTGKGLVGLPVWMWNKPAPVHTGPVTATARAGAVSVTATATVANVVWAMGDGQSVTCTGPGTPYAAAKRHDHVPGLRVHVPADQRRPARREVPRDRHHHLGDPLDRRRAAG